MWPQGSAPGVLVLTAVDLHRVVVDRLVTTKVLVVAVFQRARVQDLVSVVVLVIIVLVAAGGEVRVGAVRRAAALGAAAAAAAAAARARRTPRGGAAAAAARRDCALACTVDVVLHGVAQL